MNCVIVGHGFSGGRQAGEERRRACQLTDLPKNGKLVRVISGLCIVFGPRRSRSLHEGFRGPPSNMS